MQEQIEQLIAEYNATEQQQAARLRELFYLLKARNGYRAIKFIGGDRLDNCWDLPEERLDKVYFLDRYNRGIEGVEMGHE